MNEMKTLAQQYQTYCDGVMESSEFFDGDPDIAQPTYRACAKHTFAGKGFFRRSEVHFNDGSVARLENWYVVVVK